MRFENDVNRELFFSSGSDTLVEQTFGDAGTTALQQFVLRSTTIDTDDDSIITIAAGGASGITRGAFITARGNEVASVGGSISVSTGNTAGADINLISVDDWSFQTTAGASVMELLETGHQVFTGSDIRYRGVNASGRSMLFTADSNAGASAYLSLYSDATNGGSAQLATGVNASSDVNLSATDDVIIETRGGTDMWNFDTATGTFIGAGTGTIGWTVIPSGAGVACTTACVTPCVAGQNATFGLVTCATAVTGFCICAGAS
jgi:hypothetical protein